MKNTNIINFLKRGFDLVFSILLLPLVIVLVAIPGILICVDSRGTVILRLDMIGKGGKLFKCVRFRTMFENADEILHLYLNNNEEAREKWHICNDPDPRITRVGRFLRKTSLYELPQIFNVLSGDMSFVGPRSYIAEFKDEVLGFSDLIFLMRPGITGPWRLSGRNKTTLEERVKLDTSYVLNCSLWLDIVILFKTIKVVLNEERSY